MAVLLPLLLALGCADDAIVTPLSPTEQADGWRLLFDGRTLSGWRGYRSPSTPGNWKVVDGTLFRAAGGGDIMTVDQFGDFELRLEWRISKNGNSGIMFRVTDEGDEPWWTGPEMQVLDNEGHPDGKDPLTSAGSTYALYAPVRDVTRPVGEWNEVRIVAKGAHVEHWLNGVKVVEYELWSPDWESRVRATKFGSLPQYGRALRGHIVLQDHGDAVWYRNIRIQLL
jgi:Domain of Unknown Function (DUF1080)